MGLEKRTTAIKNKVIEKLRKFENCGLYVIISSPFVNFVFVYHYLISYFCHMRHTNSKGRKKIWHFKLEGYLSLA